MDQPPNPPLPSRCHARNKSNASTLSSNTGLPARYRARPQSITTGYGVPIPAPASARLAPRADNIQLMNYPQSYGADSQRSNHSQNTERRNLVVMNHNQGHEGRYGRPLSIQNPYGFSNGASKITTSRSYNPEQNPYHSSYTRSQDEGSGRPVSIQNLSAYPPFHRNNSTIQPTSFGEPLNYPPSPEQNVSFHGSTSFQGTGIKTHVPSASQTPNRVPPTYISQSFPNAAPQPSSLPVPLVRNVHYFRQTDPGYLLPAQNPDTRRHYSLQAEPQRNLNRHGHQRNTKSVSSEDRLKSNIASTSAHSSSDYSEGTLARDEKTRINTLANLRLSAPSRNHSISHTSQRSRGHCRSNVSVSSLDRINIMGMSSRDRVHRYQTQPPMDYQEPDPLKGFEFPVRNQRDQGVNSRGDSTRHHAGVSTDRLDSAVQRGREHSIPTRNVAYNEQDIPEQVKDDKGKEEHGREKSRKKVRFQSSTTPSLHNSSIDDTFPTD